MNWKEE